MKSPLMFQIALWSISLVPLQAAALKGHLSQKKEQPTSKGVLQADFSVTRSSWKSRASKAQKAKQPKGWTLTGIPISGEHTSIEATNSAVLNDLNSEITTGHLSGLKQNEPISISQQVEKVPDGGATLVMMLGSVFALGIIARRTKHGGTV